MTLDQPDLATMTLGGVQLALVADRRFVVVTDRQLAHGRASDPDDLRTRFAAIFAIQLRHAFRNGARP